MSIEIEVKILGIKVPAKFIKSNIEEAMRQERKDEREKVYGRVSRVFSRNHIQDYAFKDEILRAI